MPDSRKTNSDPELLLNQLADEFAARQRRGERPSLHEYCVRHPELADEIQSLFPAMVELEQAKADAGPELAVAEPEAASVTLLGDFRLLREVGRGGMGVVYEAEQISLGRRVALKLLPATVFRDPVKKRRFEREARAAAKLHHTNIVPVHGFGEHDGTPYYVMQFIQGLGLDTVIEELRRFPNSSQFVAPVGAPTVDPAAMSVALARSLVGDETAATAGWSRPAPEALSMTAAGDSTPGPVRRGRSSSASINTSSINLPGQSGSGARGSTGSRSKYWPSVARIGMQVAGAMAYAHKQGILHRDIKPANLLLDLDGIVWVTDFGLAKVDDSDNLTHTGDLVGTFRYMPPEGFEGKSDARSDVYALGLTLFELVALRPAYEQRDRSKLIKEITTGDAPRLRKLRKDAPRDLVTVIEKACEKDPSRRYPSASALADDLQRFLDGRPIMARRATEFERLRMWARRRPAIAALLMALFLCLSAGAIVSTILAIRADRFAVAATDREREATIARDVARRNADYAEQQRERAEAGQTEARDQRKRADDAAEFARQNLYYAQMHLAPQAWRGGHRSLNHLTELLSSWRPQDGAKERRGWEWFYLNSLPYQNLRTLTESGVNHRPSTVAWHVPSQRLAEGTADGLIRIWDVDRERVTLTIRSPVPWLEYWGGRWLGWSPDGRMLAAGFRDTTVHVWDSETGQELHVFRGHKSSIISVAFSSDGSRLAAWGNNGAIKIWDTNSGRLSAEVTHPGVVGAGAWSPDGQLLACGHGNGTVTVSGSSAGDKIVTLRGNFAPISSLAWSPDSTRLAATSTYDYATRIWEVASKKMVIGPLRHSHEVLAVAWEPDGRRLATGSIDETINIWDAVTGIEDLTLRGNRQAVASLAWGPNGCLASACIDGNVKVWNPVRDQESSTLPAHEGRAHSAAWSPDGKLLASGGDDGNVRIWSAATRESVLTINAHDKRQINGQFGLIRSLAWSPDSAHLASAGLDGATKVWEINVGRLCRTVRGPPDGFGEPSHREVFALPADHGSVWSVAWSADGNYLAAGAQDGTIRVIEGPGHAPRVHVFPAHQGRVRALAWSPQGNRLASGGADGLVKLWDPIRGAELVRMPGHQHWVVGVAWSPDGNRLASASSDCLVMTWDPQTGRRLTTMRGHHAWVEAVAWSPDGMRLASAGTDDSVRVWDPNTGEETFVLRGNSEMFHDVSWHRDSAQLAAANDDGQIWIWNATRGFERDTTPRALPYIDRLLATGTARGEDVRWSAEAYIRAGKTREALSLLKDDPHGLRTLVQQFVEPRNASPDKVARNKVRALLAEQLASQGDHSSLMFELSGDMYTADQDWKQAITVYGKAIASPPADVARLTKLANAYQSAGRTRDAVAHLATASSLNPADTALVLNVAALQAWFRQDKEFAATRRRILAFAKGTADAFTADRVAKACCLLHLTDPAELEAMLELARNAVKLGEGSAYLPYFRMALGMAEYRIAHFVEADAAFEAAVRSAKENRIIAGTSAFYRAMSLFRQGKIDEARTLAFEAAATMRPLPADEQNPLAGSVSHDDLILWMAYKEAKALIGFDGKNP